MMRAILDEPITVDFQHTNVKLLLDLPAGADLDPVVPVFHRWIQEEAFEELLLDVADYRHVHNGPGIILIGHEADYSLDHSDGRWGIRYNRKAAVAGTNSERLQQAFLSALAASARLEENAALEGKLPFEFHAIEVFVNDRLLAPNRQETREAFEIELRLFLDKILGVGRYSVTLGSDARRLLGATVVLPSPVTTQELLQAIRELPTAV